MDCSCNIGNDVDFCDDGFIKTYDRAARREWVCSECHEIIPIGEVYSYSSGKYDGKFFVDRTCLRCKSIAAAFPGDRYIGTLIDDLRQHIEDGKEIPSACLASMTKPARDFVCDMIEDSWS